MRDTNQVLSGYGTTIFEVMSRLAVEEGAVNLGQGFPDGQGPDDVRERACLLYTSPSPRDATLSRMPSSA